MAALKNAKHERFAQELAKGRTQAEAYESAGYKPSEPNASRLTSNDKVAARVAEILERSAVRSEITVADLTRRLLAIAAKGEAKEDASMLGVARASIMDAAKLNGLIPDKLAIAGAIDLSHTAEPAGLREALGWIAGALGGEREATD